MTEHNLMFTDDGRFLYCAICREIDIDATEHEREEIKSIYYKYDTITRVGYRNMHHANKDYKSLQCN